MREKLASLPVGGDPVAAAIEGVYGRDWKGVLWKEYREARGTDARSLWAGLCRIGRVLGKPEEDWRRTFVQALPERVSSQLLMVCRSEERQSRSGKTNSRSKPKLKTSFQELY